jgi:hypothetical protein
MCSRQPLTFYYCTTSSVMGQNADISTLWAAINTESGQKWHCHWTLIKRLPEENHAPKSVFAQMMILSWNARIFWTMYPRLVFFSQIALRIDGDSKWQIFCKDWSNRVRQPKRKEETKYFQPFHDLCMSTFKLQGPCQLSSLYRSNSVRCLQRGQREWFPKVLHT